MALVSLGELPDGQAPDIDELIKQSDAHFHLRAAQMLEVLGTGTPEQDLYLDSVNAISAAPGMTKSIGSPLLQIQVV